MSEYVSFSEEIDKNKNATEVPSKVTSLETAASSLDVRLRGAYITDCELTSPSTGSRIDVLFAENDITKPKLTATHPMVPAGPYEGVGGQHGFPRWSDYHEFPTVDGPDGSKHVSVQAMRSDNGLSIVKTFELAESVMTSRTSIANSREETENTSMGEHLYFSLVNEDMDGLMVNGMTIDELLGDGSEKLLMDSGTLFWDFGGEAIIHFPAGHTIRLSAEFEGTTKYPLAMWVWKRDGSPSICFEPIVGVKHLDGDDTSGVELTPYAEANLTTKIELL